MEDELIAHNHVTQAHEALKGGCCLNLFKSLADRRTEAREHYRNAGNLFKKCNKFFLKHKLKKIFWHKNLLSCIFIFFIVS